MVSPTLAASPVPSLRSVIFSSVGAVPGNFTVGFGGVGTGMVVGGRNVDTGAVVEAADESDLLPLKA